MLQFVRALPLLCLVQPGAALCLIVVPQVIQPVTKCLPLGCQGRACKRSAQRLSDSPCDSSRHRGHSKTRELHAGSAQQPGCRPGPWSWAASTRKCELRIRAQRRGNDWEYECRAPSGEGRRGRQRNRTLPGVHECNTDTVPSTVLS